ncbi:VWA domain-containing protein [bacterium]|nr:VWA domain-containing protein [bacterium]
MLKKIILICFVIFCVNIAFAESYRVQSPNNPDIEVKNEQTLFILDFSNSMNEFLNSRKKVDIMLDTMREILPKINPQNPVGMRAYGYRTGVTPYDSCKASKLMVPITKGGNHMVLTQIEKTRAVGMTPITYSLKLALNKDFKYFNGQKHIILLTDGGENCDESPCTFMTKNLRFYPNVKIDVIAYDIRNSDDISQLECVALVTRGQFYTANTAAELANSLNNSLNIEKEVEGKIILP